MNVEIKNDLLFIDGKQVAFKKSPNISGAKNHLEYLVEHYTATFEDKSPINWLTNKESQVSAHLVIAKDGTVTQLAPFTAVCWHAGQSEWKGINGLNSYAIGIEIVNSGIVSKKGDVYRSADGYIVKDFKELTNKLGLKAVWETYPDVQIQVVAAVSKALKEHYSLKEIIGHEDIAPRRKTDPGPAFPWDVIRGTSSTTPKSTKRTTTVDLNLRMFPDGASQIIKVLKKGSEVYVSSEKGDWSFTGDGWVATRYLA